jgi:hypothetical protein
MSEMGKNQVYVQVRRILSLTICILLALLFLTACRGKEQPRGITLYVPTHTSQPAEVGIVPSATPAPQIQPSSPTITPQVGPQAVLRLITAVPPAGSFSPPEINVSVLALQNASNYTLQLLLEGFSQPITLPPGGSTERQLAPGNYLLRALIPEYRAEVFNETVTLENNTRHTLTLQVPESTLAFDNQSAYTLQVILIGSGTTYTIQPGAISRSVPVAPGSYAYQVFAVGVPDLQPLSGEAAVEPGEQVTITLSVDTEETASLAFNNLTAYEAVVTLDGGFPSITIPAMALSEPLMLPPGDYAYSVVLTGANTLPLTGSATLAAGDAITISISLSPSPALSQWNPVLGARQYSPAGWVTIRANTAQPIQPSWVASRGMQ